MRKNLAPDATFPRGADPSSRRIRKTPLAGRRANLAERGGFEPPRRYKRLPDFESGTFNRSATSPGLSGRAGPGRGRNDTGRHGGRQGGGGTLHAVFPVV